MIKQHHPFHIVQISPWPLLTAFSTLAILTGVVNIIITKNTSLLFFRNVILILSCSQWWRDVSREGSFQGFHSTLVMLGLRWGIILFITSEILFFASFFWAFFHRSLSPNIDLGTQWPPLGLQAINPYQVPLLNTVVLISSGALVTWRHHSLILKNNKTVKNTLLITILLGVYFTCLQAWEYFEASYTLRDSSFGSRFFLATGFHGIHVLVGSLFLLFSLHRHNIRLFSLQHHLGFEAAIWYWHFVDVVWLFLYIFIYWW